MTAFSDPDFATQTRTRTRSNCTHAFIIVIRRISPRPSATNRRGAPRKIWCHPSVHLTRRRDRSNMAQATFAQRWLRPEVRPRETTRRRVVVVFARIASETARARRDRAREAWATLGWGRSRASEHSRMHRR